MAVFLKGGRAEDFALKPIAGPLADKSLSGGSGLKLRPCGGKYPIHVNLRGSGVETEGRPGFGVFCVFRG
jgi:hypothetical protein